MLHTFTQGYFSFVGKIIVKRNLKSLFVIKMHFSFKLIQNQKTIK